MFLETAAVATDQSVVMTHVTVAALAVSAIQWLKKTRLVPWINAERPKLLRIIAIVTAAIGAVGINYTWHPETRDLIFHIPTLSAAVGLGVAWVKSFAMQEIVYQGTAKNGTSELLRELITKLQQQGIVGPIGGRMAASPVIGSAAVGGTAGGPIGVPRQPGSGS